MSLYRRVRGFAGTVALWAVGWSVVVVALSAAVVLLDWRRPLAERLNILPFIVTRMPIAGAFWGAVAGTVFSAFVIGSRRRQKGLTPRLAAAWDAAGGGLLASVGFAANAAQGLPMAPQFLVIPVIGATIGAGYVWLASRAREPQAHGGAEIPDVPHASLGGGDVSSMESRLRGGEERPERAPKSRD